MTTDKTFCVSKSCPLRRKCGRHVDNLPGNFYPQFMSHADLSECKTNNGMCAFYEEVKE